jgi:N-acetylglucosamine-6-phosphate deacetylase
LKLAVTHALTGEVISLHLQGLSVDRSTELTVARDLYVSPGWIDVQVNGFAGYDVNAANLEPEQVKEMVRVLWRLGITRLLPTVITESYAHIERCLSVIADACRDPDVAVSVAGIHLEGPYISPLEGARGAHPEQHVRAPDWEEFLGWQQAAKGLIRLVTLSPEHRNAVDFIERATAAGVVVGIGHTLASTAQIEAAVAAGAKLATHLGNGAPATIVRHPNPIWDQLANDALTASFIFDGHHLPSNVMKVMLRAKGKDKSLLISDAVALAGMPPGIYDTPVGGEVELHPNGRLTLLGTSYLAGSANGLIIGIENALRLGECSLAEALAMVSINPAKLLGLAFDGYWTVFRYEASSFTVTPLATIAGGELKYHA